MRFGDTLDLTFFRRKWYTKLNRGEVRRNTKKTGGTTMSFANYVRKYDVGSIRLDAPYAHFVHELPILSFGDILHTVNLSLVYQSKMTDNPFYISNGFKLNIQKRIIFSSNGVPEYFEESDGSRIMQAISQERNTIPIQVPAK